MHFHPSSHALSTTLLLTSLISSSTAAPWQMLKIAKALVHPSASSPFTLTASHAGSPIHLEPINAQGNAFYIGNITESSCPTTPGGAPCPPGNITALTTTSAGNANMDVEVPAGQSIFVNGTDGSLQYTVAHSNVIPTGAKAKQFALFKGPQYSFFVFSGVGKASGFLACPVNATVYKVYADLPSLTNANVVGGNVTACVGFDALATAYQGYAAWQYE